MSTPQDTQENDTMAPIQTTQLVRSICSSKWYTAYQLMQKDGMDYKQVSVNWVWDIFSGPMVESLLGVWAFSLLKLNNKVYEVTAYLEEQEANQFYDTAMVDDMQLHTWLLNNRQTWKSCDLHHR